MSKLLFFAAILFSTFFTVSAQVKPPVDDSPRKCIKRTAFDSLGLSGASEAAVLDLVKATRFETGPVGFAGSPSAYIRHFQTILNEPNASGIFGYIYDEGTIAAKLYALNGLYLTDKRVFDNVAESMKKSAGSVQVLNGCLMSDEQVSKIVESDAANVAIIEPGKTMKDFWAANAGAHELDIVHGGYPATFKEFADTRVRNLK